MQKIREINPSLTYLVIIFMIITMLFTLRSITYFSNAKKINEQVAPIEWADIEQLYKEKREFDDEIYYIIHLTQKASAENYIIKKNKTIYIDKGSSRLLVNIILLTGMLMFLSILVI